MKKIIMVVLVVFVLILNACKNKEETVMLVDGKIPFQEINTSENSKDFAIGDINGDGIYDTATLMTPILITDSNGTHCETNCYCTIFFDASDDGIIHDDAKNGIIMDAGDLNNDGRSEIAFIPYDNDDFLSDIYIYTLKEDGWHIISQTPMYYDSSLNNEYQKRITFLENNSYSITPLTHEYTDNTAIKYYDF